MKTNSKLLVTLVATFVLSSCENEVYDTERLQAMKSPIIVVGKSDISAILQDREGKLYVARKGYYIDNAIISSYKLGDTLLTR